MVCGHVFAAGFSFHSRDGKLKARAEMCMSSLKSLSHWGDGWKYGMGWKRDGELEGVGNCCEDVSRITVEAEKRKMRRPEHEIHPHSKRGIGDLILFRPLL